MKTIIFALVLFTGFILAQEPAASDSLLNKYEALSQQAYASYNEACVKVQEAEENLKQIQAERDRLKGVNHAYYMLYMEEKAKVKRAKTDKKKEANP